jgi:hypothetical protein
MDKRKMKLKLLTIAIVAALATGCASNKPEPVTKVQNKLEQKPDIKKAEAEFLEVSGTLQLQFSEDGDWVAIKTTGTAPINFNHPQGREDAFMLATMRAKRNLVEFLTNDVKSGKVAENVTKTAMRDIVSNKNTEDRRRDSKNDNDSLFGSDGDVTGGMYSEEERRRASKIAQSVTETISDNSQFILKGAYVANRTVDRDSNMVAVTIMVSKKSMNTAAQVRTMMNGF